MKAQVFPWRNRCLVFLAVPKNGSSSIKWALRNARHIELPNPIWKIHTMWWPEEMGFEMVRSSGCLSFAVIRDPVDRLVSCFRSKMHPDRIDVLTDKHEDLHYGMSFESFVSVVCDIPDEESDEHFASQTHLLSDDKGLIPERLLRFEELDQDWNRLGRNLPALRRMNTSEETAILPRPEVTSHIQKLILRRYEKDIVLKNR